MACWIIMDGANLVSKADLADVLKQVEDKSSDLYQDKPAPFWMTASVELHLSGHRNYGKLHGNIVCFCHLCLMDVAKADTFLGEHIDQVARNIIMRRSEDEKFDIVTEFFKVSMCSEIRTRNVSAALLALCPNKVGLPKKVGLQT